MKKKLMPLAFLVVAICLSIFIGRVFVVSAAEYANAESADFVYFSNVNRSVEIYDQAISQYIEGVIVRGGEEIVTYSDDFAGAFIDSQGFLNIGHLSQRSSLGFDGRVIFREQAFSYNHLLNIKETVVSAISDYGSYSVGIDEEFNRVFVNLNNESQALAIMAFLEERNLYNELSLSFTINPDAQIIKTSNLARGGGSIDGGTMCVNVIDNATGNIGILTNEHVAPVGTAMWHGGNALGTSLRGQYGGTVDAAFVPFANQNNWSPTTHGRLDAAGSTLYSNIRLGNNNHIIQGRPVRRLGRTTGDTTGTIASTNVSYAISGTNFNNMFTFTNFSEAGDSGGPVYWNDSANSQLFLIGMNHATDWTVGYGCRIVNAMNVLNVTPITNDSINFTTSGNNITITGLNFNPTGALVIPEFVNGRTVTEISNGAFQGCNNLISISLPFVGKSASATGYEAVFGYIFGYTLKIFDPYFSPPSSGILQYTSSGGTILFYYYHIPLSLRTVTVNGGNINYNAFFNCDMLTNVEMNNVASIGVSAFVGCSNLGGITIPATVSNISSSAFGRCSSMTGTTVVPDNQWYSSQKTYSYQNGILYNKAKTEIIYVPEAISGDIIIPGGISTVFGFSDRTQITNVIISEGVTSIGNGAFSHCTGLTSITIPSSVTSIEDYAFYNCTKLATITFNAASMNDLSSNKDIFYNAGQNVSGITLNIGPNVTKIPAYLFQGITKLTAVNFIGTSVCTTIGASAFADCTGLSSITIPSSITSIGSNSFQNCSNLTLVFYNGTNITAWNNLGTNHTPANATVYIYSATAPTQAGNYWRLVSGVPTVWNNSSYNQGLSFTPIGNNTAYIVSRGNAAANQIDIPVTFNGLPVTKVAAYGFAGYANLTSITIPDSVTSIGNGAFLNTGIWNNTANNSVVYAGKWAVGYKGKLNGDLTLKSDTKGIGEYAFSNCLELTNVIVPYSVTIIGFSAFSGCSNLESTTLPFIGNTLSGTSNTHIGYIFGAEIVISSPLGPIQSSRIPSSLNTITVTGGNIANGAFLFCAFENLIITNNATVSSYASLFSIIANTIKFASGIGTEQDPFIINTKTQLVSFAALVNTGNSYFYNKYFALGANINLGGMEWTPIGYIYDIEDVSARAFQGHFDGNGYTVSNFIITQNNHDNPYNGICVAGFFGLVDSGAVIKNLGVTDFYIDLSIYGVEGLSVFEGYDNFVGFAGGFARLNNGGVISNCYSEGDIFISATGFIAGGFVGANYGVISECYSACGVTVVLEAEYIGEEIIGVFVGGFAGYHYGGYIVNCYAVGDVSASSVYVMAGGFVGINYNGYILNCYAAGNITAVSDLEAAVGGFVGINLCLSSGGYLGRISDCYAAGNITAYDNTGYANISASGFVGAYLFNVTYNSYYYDGQEISIYDNSGGSYTAQAGGGFANSFIAEITEFYSGKQESFGLMGGQSSSSAAASITECTLEQLDTEDFYVTDLGWDANVWDFSALDFESGVYPILFWQV